LRRTSSFLSYELKNCRAQAEIITFYNLVIILAARITHTHTRPAAAEAGLVQAVCVCARLAFAAVFGVVPAPRRARVCECVSSSLMLSISLQLGSLLYFQWFPQHSHSPNVTCGGPAPKKAGECVCEGASERASELGSARAHFHSFRSSRRFSPRDTNCASNKHQEL
jgi:hypothetical protein